MEKIWLCEWCINGLSSHGEKIYQSNETDERECEQCGEYDICYECIEGLESCLLYTSDAADEL